MLRTIDNESELSEVLQEYTGSRAIPYDLRSWFQYAAQYNTRGMEYRTYSRRKSTLMLGKTRGNPVILVDVWDKYVRKSWDEGIDNAILQLIEPYIIRGGKIIASWNHRLHVVLPLPVITEAEIIILFKLGFTSYYTDGVEQEIIMK